MHYSIEDGQWRLSRSYKAGERAISFFGDPFSACFMVTGTIWRLHFDETGIRARVVANQPVELGAVFDGEKNQLLLLHQDALDIVQYENGEMAFQSMTRLDAVILLCSVSFYYVLISVSDAAKIGLR